MNSIYKLYFLGQISGAAIATMIYLETDIGLWPSIYAGFLAYLLVDIRFEASK